MNAISSKGDTNDQKVCEKLLNIFKSKKMQIKIIVCHRTQTKLQKLKELTIANTGKNENKANSHLLL